jgi:hypothetical protein
LTQQRCASNANFLLFLTDVLQENETPAADAGKRPIRPHRGQGGHAVQLQKAAESIRPDLNPNTGLKKQPAPRRSMGSFPSGAPENEMAPPATQRQKKKPVSTFIV